MDEGLVLELELLVEKLEVDMGELVLVEDVRVEEVDGDVVAHLVEALPLDVEVLHVLVLVKDVEGELVLVSRLSSEVTRCMWSMWNCLLSEGPSVSNGAFRMLRLSRSVSKQFGKLTAKLKSSKAMHVNLIMTAQRLDTGPEPPGPLILRPTPSMTGPSTWCYTVPTRAAAHGSAFVFGATRSACSASSCPAPGLTH